MNWNTLIIFYIKIHTQYQEKKFIQTLFSKHIDEPSNFFLRMGNFSAMLGVVLVSQTLVLLEEESSPCLAIVNQNRVFSQWTRLKIVKNWREKGVPMLGLKTVTTSSWSFSQWQSTSSRSDTWYPLVSISGAPTLESNSSLISCVHCWLGLIETRDRWLSKYSLFWDNHKLQAARRFSWELNVISWTRSFPVRVTESGQNSIDHSIPSLETDKIMFFYCRLKCIKWDKKWILG